MILGLLTISPMPFKKNFPALGTTSRLRIPEKIAPHFESILEHLNRQVQLLGQDYIEAFFEQCSSAMRELEFSSTSLLDTPLNQPNHDELKIKFVEHCNPHEDDYINNSQARQTKTYSTKYMSAHCKVIGESLEKLKK